MGFESVILYTRHHSLQTFCPQTLISALCSLAFRSSQLRSAPVDLLLPLQPSVKTQLIAHAMQTIKSNKKCLTQTVICSKDILVCIYVLFAYLTYILQIIDENYLLD